MRKLLLIGILLSFFMATPSFAAEKEPSINELKLTIQLIQSQMDGMLAKYNLLKSVALPQAQAELQKALDAQKKEKEKSKKK